MAGADTILRVIAVGIFLMVLAFVTAVGFALVDPIFTNIGGPPSSLGWGPLGENVIFWMSVSLIGLGVVVIIWMWVSPIRDDVRQDVERRGGL